MSRIEIVNFAEMTTPDIFAPTKNTNTLNQENTEKETDSNPEKEKSNKRKGIEAKIRDAADPVKIK